MLWSGTCITIKEYVSAYGSMHVNMWKRGCMMTYEQKHATSRNYDYDQYVLNVTCQKNRMSTHIPFS
jgi:hypothetical protein